VHISLFCHTGRFIEFFFRSVLALNVTRLNPQGQDEWIDVENIPKGSPIALR
jgi:hypothetical protein